MLTLPSAPCSHPAPAAARAHRPAALLCCLALSCSVLSPLPAAAAKKGAARKPAAVKVRQQQHNSQESAAERDRRLYRECQGKPNAGACLGYTRR